MQLSSERRSFRRAHNQEKCGLAAQMIDERRSSRPSVMCHAWALGGLPGRVGARSSDSTSVLPFIMVAGERHERSTLCPAPSMRLTRCLALVGRRPRQQAMRRSSQLVRATKPWRRSRISIYRTLGSSPCAVGNAGCSRSGSLTGSSSGCHMHLFTSVVIRGNGLGLGPINVSGTVFDACSACVVRSM